MTDNEKIRRMMWSTVFAACMTDNDCTMKDAEEIADEALKRYDTTFAEDDEVYEDG